MFWRLNYPSACGHHKITTMALSPSRQSDASGSCDGFFPVGMDMSPIVGAVDLLRVPEHLMKYSLPGSAVGSAVGSTEISLSGSLSVTPTGATPGASLINTPYEFFTRSRVGSDADDAELDGLEESVLCFDKLCQELLACGANDTPRGSSHPRSDDNSSDDRKPKRSRSPPTGHFETQLQDFPWNTSPANVDCIATDPRVLALKLLECEIARTMKCTVF